jgi:hypothetical protein
MTTPEEPTAGDPGPSKRHGDALDEVVEDSPGPGDEAGAAADEPAG